MDIKQKLDTLEGLIWDAGIPLGEKDELSGWIHKLAKLFEVPDKEGNCRLKTIKVSAYGKSATILEILRSMTDEDLQETFSQLYESLLQEKRIK